MTEAERRRRDRFKSLAGAPRANSTREGRKPPKAYTFKHSDAERKRRSDSMKALHEKRRAGLL